MVFEGGGRQSTREHEDYLAREGVDRDGGRGELYGAHTDQADGAEFAERSKNDRHQFRFIVSPEDATKIDDLKTYTRDLMAQMERDLGTKLDWVAVDHWDTDNPHTHVLLRGKADDGRDLIIARDYLSSGMRSRAAEIATQWLGPRTELEIRESLVREVEQERWTSLDQSIHRELTNGRIDLRRVPIGSESRFQRSLRIGRLDRLAKMGLSNPVERGIWTVSEHAQSTLRSMGERGDIIRRMQRAFSAGTREYEVFDATKGAANVTGCVAGRGFTDELHEHGYLIVDGVDGRAHYVALPASEKPTSYSFGSIVTAHGAAPASQADRTIAAVAERGTYRVERHLEQARLCERNPDAFVQAHVRRLEALRRAGIVQRLEEGVWRVPSDLIERGQAYDVKRAPGASIEVHAERPIQQQVRAVGATWLDRQLVGTPEALSSGGFGGQVRHALTEREMFLVEHRFAERRGQRVIFMRDMLATLRAREVEQATQVIAAETGLIQRPLHEGESVSGVYRKPVSLVSGRYAMLVNGAEFSLVPWRPLIDKRLGQPLSASLQGNQVSWHFGRTRGPAL